MIEGNGHPVGLVVAHHAGHFDRLEGTPIEVLEILPEEGAQNLAGSVLAEIEGEETVPRLDPGAGGDAGRQDELVILPRGIGLLDGRPGRTPPVSPSPSTRQRQAFSVRSQRLSRSMA
jgi:hypothetical protein